MKPKRPRIAMTSAPERRRSLGMRWQKFHGHDDGWIRREPQGSKILIRQMEGHGILKVFRDLVQRAALSDDRDFDALRYISRLLARSNHCFDGVLKHRRQYSSLSSDRMSRTTDRQPLSVPLRFL